MPAARLLALGDGGFGEGGFGEGGFGEGGCSRMRSRELGTRPFRPALNVLADRLAGHTLPGSQCMRLDLQLVEYAAQLC